MNVKLGSKKFKEKSRNTFWEDVSQQLGDGKVHVVCEVGSDNKFLEEMIILT